MKSLHTLFRTRYIAAAIAGIGIATGVLAQTPFQANQLGTPDDGMVCRPGYTAVFGANNMKCSKSHHITVVLECFNPTFPTYVNRAPGAPHDTSGGLDLCTRPVGSPGAINLGPTDSLGGLTLSTNGTNGAYEFAKVNPATVASRVNKEDQAEASALGLSVNEVDTSGGPATVNLNKGVGGIKDNADVLVTHYTFAIPNGLIVIGGPLSTAR